MDEGHPGHPTATVSISGSCVHRGGRVQANNYYLLIVQRRYFLHIYLTARGRVEEDVVIT